MSATVAPADLAVAALAAPAVIEDATRRNADVDFQVRDLPRVRVGRPDASTPATVSLTASHGTVTRLFLGEKSEALLLLSGDLVLTGDLPTLMRFFPVMATASAEYRQSCGEPPQPYGRYAALSELKPPPGLTRMGSPPLLEDEPAHQALVAALLVASLPAACRAFELRTIRAGVVAERVPEAIFDEFLIHLANLASRAAIPADAAAADREPTPAPHPPQSPRVPFGRREETRVPDDASHRVAPSVLDFLQARLASGLGVDPADVSREARLREDLGVGSHGLIGLLIELEDRFGLIVTDQQGSHLRTVGDVSDLVDDALSSPADQVPGGLGAGGGRSPTSSDGTPTAP